MTNPPAHPLSFPDYRRFLLARMCGVLAQSLMVVVIGWQAYETARGAMGMSIKEASFQLGMIGLAQFLPLFLLSPITGLAADKFERRRIGQIAMGLDGVTAAMLAWATWHGQMSLPLLYLASIMHGAVRGFIGPALSSLAPNLVPRDVLPRAIAFSSTNWQIARIAGPVVAGFAYAAAPALPYFLAVMMLGAALIALHVMAPVPQDRITSKASPFRLMAEGFDYVWHNKMLLGCITLDLFAVLLGGATAMLPAFARDLLHVGASGLGLMRAAPAVGAVLAGLILSQHPIKRNVGVNMLLAVGVYGLATALFGLSTTLWFSLAMLAVLGAADMVSVFIRATLEQLFTPDDKRGRVMAIAGVFISASNELGEAESGLLAALVGPVIAVVAGGIGAIAITMLWARLFPVIRTTKSFDAPASTAIEREAVT